MKTFEFPFNISLKFIPKGPIDNIPALVQIIATVLSPQWDFLYWYDTIFILNRGPESLYSRWTRSIWLQLMPWLLVLPGNQQQCHWICCIDELSFITKDFYLCLFSIEKWWKMEIYTCIYSSRYYTFGHNELKQLPIHTTWQTLTMQTEMAEETY